MQAKIALDAKAMLTRAALAFFVVSLCWPSPRSDKYVPSIVLVVQVLGALPFAGVGYMRGEIIEPTWRVLRLLIGGLLPNILMFMFVYKLFRHKTFSNKLCMLYLADFIFVCVFISIPMSWDYFQNHPVLSLVSLSKLGGVILWTAALLLMTLALFYADKNKSLSR